MGSRVERELLRIRNLIDDALESIEEKRRRRRKNESKYVLVPLKGSQHIQQLQNERFNVVDVLTLYLEVWKGDTLSRLNHFVDELRVAAQNGEFLGETYVSYNRLTPNKTEFIQFGVPMFGQMKAGYIEPIPARLQGLIEQVVEHNLFRENRRPNACKINFFDEGEYSKILVKTPHVDPVFTVILSESRIALGDTIANHGLGNYEGSLSLSIRKGSLLVMKDEDASGMQAICSSPNKRITINFFKVRSEDDDAN